MTSAAKGYWQVIPRTLDFLNILVAKNWAENLAHMDGLKIADKLTDN